MNRHGRTARFAWDPQVVLAYIDVLENADARAPFWTDAVQGRTIRRWRTAEGITRQSLNNVLACYTGAEERRFLAWCESKDYINPVIRDRRKEI